MLKPPLAISGTLCLFLSEGGGLSMSLYLVTLCLGEKEHFSSDPSVASQRGEVEVLQGWELV